MPGVFLLRGNAILWRWKYRNIGDHPDFSSLSELVSKVAADPLGSHQT